MTKTEALAAELYAALNLAFNVFSQDGYVTAAERDKALNEAAGALARWEERDWSDYDPRKVAA